MCTCTCRVHVGYMYATCTCTCTRAYAPAHHGQSVPPVGRLRLSAHADRDVPEADVGAFEVVHNQFEAFMIANLLRNIPYREQRKRCIDIILYAKCIRDSVFIPSNLKKT